ncbi:MAG TPA: BTAD domain-containing putative transcriptional regulator [Dehalococcoidia bacterium]|nr:BTAD domain-containing putative transcriptional regulator [Dehalococcoidia bacterium]
MPTATSPELQPLIGTYPALPFVLGMVPSVQEDARIPAILRNLESLHAIAAESRRELDHLLRLSQEILLAVRTPAPAPPSQRPEAPVRDSALVHISLLGSFDVEAAGRSVTRWPSKKARLLLAYLAMEKGRMVPRDVLIDLFWPDAPPARGSNNLSIAIHQIRSTLAEVAAESAKCVLVRQGACGLDPSVVSTDLWDFQQRLASARQALESRDTAGTRSHLVSALAMYHGELLESDPYEEWVVEPRRTLSAAYYQALSWVTTQSAKDDDWRSVLDYASLMVKKEPFDEAAHRWLMQAHWRLGNRSQALQQYRACEEVLKAELGLPPSEETRRLFEVIRGK